MWTELDKVVLLLQLLNISAIVYLGHGKRGWPGVVPNKPEKQEIHQLIRTEQSYL